MTGGTDSLALARRYLQAIEAGATGDALAAFFAPDAVQEEFPNRLVPNGARRDVPAILDAALRGQAVLAAQRFEIRHALVSGDRVALEVGWTGTLAVAIGALAPGDSLRADFAVFLDYRDGLILRQRNYDCFTPW